MKDVSDHLKQQKHWRKRLHAESARQPLLKALNTAQQEILYRTAFLSSNNISQKMFHWSPPSSAGAQIVSLHSALLIFFISADPQNICSQAGELKVANIITNQLLNETFNSAWMFAHNNSVILSEQ